MFNCCRNVDVIDWENATLDTPKFALKGRITTAKCVKCYDGDTIHLVFPFYDKLTRWVCRINNIDCAEIRSHNNLEKKKAIEARDFLKNLILNKKVNIVCGDFDKYGRLLVNLSINNQDISKLMVKNNYAYFYDGKTKKKFEDWYIPCKSKKAIT